MNKKLRNSAAGFFSSSTLFLYSLSCWTKTESICFSYLFIIHSFENVRVIIFGDLQIKYFLRCVYGKTFYFMGMLLEGQEESCQILVTREHWHGLQISFYFAIACLRDHVSVLINAAVHTGEIMGGCLFWLLSLFSFNSFHTGCVWMCEHCQQQARLQIIFSASMLWIVLHKY